jgi:hypothetical protein
MNQGVYNTIEKVLPNFNEWHRSSAAPTASSVPGWGSLLEQKQEGVAGNEYINQKVFDAIDKEIPAMQWQRSANAPSGPAVAGWDGLAQLEKEEGSKKYDVANNKYINHGVYDFVRNNVPEGNEWSRSSTAPKGAMVKGWDGLAQTSNPSEDQWPRRSTAPVGSEVKGWDGLAQKGDVAANEYINQKVYNSIEHVLPAGNQWHRSANAPTGPAVAGWDGLAQKSNQDIKDTPEVSQEVY